MSKKKMGRPSVYDTRIKPNLQMIAELRMQGKTHDDIIQLLGISKTAYFKHKREIEDFTHLLKNSDAELIAKLENSLYDLALGKAKETTITTNDKGHEETRVKQLAPNNVALFFALTNLKGEKWKHKQEVVVDDANDDLQSFEEVLKNRNDNE